MKTTPKTFLEALNLIHSDAKKAKTFLTDKRLTLNEKKILSCWYLLRSSKHSEIIEILSELNDQNELIECQRLLILGLAYNNQGASKEAYKFISSSLLLLEKFNLHSHHFTAVFNLFIASYNEGNVPSMSGCIKVMERILQKTKNERHNLSYLQCQIGFNLYTNNLVLAEKLMAKINDKTELMSDIMVINHLFNKFGLEVKKDNLPGAESLLGEYKNHRIFRSSPDFTFMRSMLDHLIHHCPLYVYKEDFKDCDLLFLQLKVIQSMEESDLASARKYWSQLMKMNEKTYQENFRYFGEKNLFSICLARYQFVIKVANNEIQEPLQVDTSSNKSEALIALLQSSSVPMRKEVVFKAIWGTEIESENDEAKIRNLISYVRKSKQIKISFKRGCYFIDEMKENEAA